TIKPTLKMLWGVRHVAAYKLPGAPARFARDDFAALPAICRRWSPTWDPKAEDLAAVRAGFSHRGSLNAASGYYRALRPTPPAYLRRPIEVPTVAFAGLQDPIIDLDEYRRAARMFTKEYIVEEVPGGHFLHREAPALFAERLLSHL